MTANATITNLLTGQPETLEKFLIALSSGALLSPDSGILSKGQRLAGGTFNTSTVYGYKILNAGSGGNWTFISEDGAETYTVTSTEAASMVGIPYIEKCSSIECATSGVAIIYTEMK